MYVKNFPVFHRCKISPDAVQVVQRPLAAPPLAHRARHPPRHGHVRRHNIRQLPGIKYLGYIKNERNFLRQIQKRNRNKECIGNYLKDISS